MTTIAIASDHAGFDLKETLKMPPLPSPYQWEDLGAFTTDSCDYPDMADGMAEAFLTKGFTRGVLICGSGIGISIAANRHPHIRAALCQYGLMARLARQHNDANVLVLGSRLIGIQVALDCVEVFLTTPFEGGRHEARVQKLSNAVKR